MSVSPASAPPSVRAAIDAARDAVSPDEARTTSELVDVDFEINKLDKAIDNLRQQRETLLEYRGGVEERVRELRPLAEARAHERLYDVLEAQATAVHRRGEAWTASPDMSAEDPELEPFDGPELGVDVVCCVDAHDDQPEMLILLLPVRPEVDDPATATETLPTWLASRVGQAVFGAARASGFADADVRSGPALGRDLLDIEIDLSAAPTGFVSTVHEELERLLTDAPELRAAKLAVRVVDVEPAVVFPSEAHDD